MLDNLATDEEKSKDSRNVVLQEDTENSMDGARKQQRKSLKEKDNKKDNIGRIHLYIFFQLWTSR